MGLVEKALQFVELLQGEVGARPPLLVAAASVPTASTAESRGCGPALKSVLLFCRRFCICGWGRKWDSLSYDSLDSCPGLIFQERRAEIASRDSEGLYGVAIGEYPIQMIKL